LAGGCFAGIQLAGPILADASGVDAAQMEQYGVMTPGYGGLEVSLSRRAGEDRWLELGSRLVWTVEPYRVGPDAQLTLRSYGAGAVFVGLAW